jgi:hypothetical protein
MTVPVKFFGEAIPVGRSLARCSLSFMVSILLAE